MPSLNHRPLVLCILFLACAAFTAPPAAPSAAPPSTRPATPESLLAEVTTLDLPNFTYSSESIARFNLAYQKLPPEKRERLSTAIGELLRENPDAPELPRLLPLRWRHLSLTYDRTDFERFEEISNLAWLSPSPTLARLGTLEQTHQHLTDAEERIRRGDVIQRHPFQYALANILQRHPGDPDAAFFFRRAVESLPPSPERDAYEQTLLTTYADTSAAKQHLARKLLAEDAPPLHLPFELPKEADGKPLLIHFWSPATPGQAAHFDALKSLANKHKDAISILCLPVTSTPNTIKPYCEKNNIPFPQIQSPEFTTSQGITEAELPLTYFLTPERKLAAILDNPRMEKPLTRLLNR